MQRSYSLPFPPVPDDLSRAHDFLEELDTLSGIGVLIVNL